MTDLPDAIESRLIELPTGLRDHVERCRAVAQELAVRHGVDPKLADIGTAAHDLARATKKRVLLSEAERLGLGANLVERNQPLLLHGPVAAAWLSEDDDYNVGLIIESVKFHTTGHPGMSEVAKVVFLADKIDPWKVERVPFLASVQEMARTDLDAAILHYLDKTIERLIDDGQMVHPTAMDFRNDLISRGVRL